MKKVVWNKGKKLSKEHRNNLSKARKNFYKNNPHPKGMLGKTNKWGHHTEETKILIGEKGMGRPAWNKGKKLPKMKYEQKMKISKALKGRTTWNKGIPCSEESRKKNSETHKKSFKEGKIQWNYIDGRSKGKGSGKYGCDWQKIRQLIIRRDNFTCQECGAKNKKLDIHHRIPFLMSFDNSLENLMSLCRSCHVKLEGEIIKQVKNQMEIKCISQ